MLKVLSNFYAVNVAGQCELQPSASNEKGLAWSAYDCSYGVLVLAHRALVFASSELAWVFKDASEEMKGLRWPVVPMLSG